MEIGQEIYHDQNGKYTALPDWCYSYMQLGALIASISSSDRRLVLALAVPTRAFVVPFIGAGLVLERLNRETEAVSLEEHLQMLGSLEKDTPVIIHEGTKKTRGLLIGVNSDFSDGQIRVGVQVQSLKGGAMTRWLPAHRSISIAVMEGASARLLRLPRASKQEELVKNQAFVNHFWSLDAQRIVATRSRTECIIVGQVNLLKREVTETVLAVPDHRDGTEHDGSYRPAGAPGNLAEGCLQDIMRIRRFCTNREAFRSILVPATNVVSSSLEDDVEGESTVLFDGATGFLKGRHRWPNADLVVVLDRTDPYFIDAVSLINQGFGNRLEEAEIQYEATGLPGIELMSYWERK